jgi:6-pyruvoyltetrahydropterin/6-carboxytetrahydropterin synthase
MQFYEKMRKFHTDDFIWELGDNEIIDKITKLFDLDNTKCYYDGKPAIKNMVSFGYHSPSSIVPLCGECIKKLLDKEDNPIVHYAKVTKIFNFNFAHFLPNYKGCCSNLHGHSAKIEVTLYGPIHPDTGMIMDFKVMKNIIDYILNNTDKNLNNILENPTAENLILYLWAKISLELKFLHRIKLWETDDSFVELKYNDFNYN